MSSSDRKVIEAVLLLADEPVPATALGEVLERPRVEIEQLLSDLAEAYESEERGFVLRRTHGGWRLYTHPDCSPWLERFVTTRSHARLSGAALEVLAIIAYRQPVSRAQINEIRGVDSDRVVRTLMDRGLVGEAGRDSGPGSSVLLRVSDTFLERIGATGIEDLPPLKDFMPDADVVAEMESRLSPNA